MNFIVNLMLPLGVLLYMNIAIYNGIKKLRGAPASTHHSTATHSNVVGSNANNAALKTPRLGAGGCSSKLQPPKIDPEAAAASLTSSHHQSSEDEEERERDARFTRTSILMVLAFGLCHTPRLITNTVEMFGDRSNLPHVN